MNVSVKRFLCRAAVCLFCLGIILLGDLVIRKRTEQLVFRDTPECHAMLVNTYLRKIQDASREFYSEYFTITPTVDVYSVSVTEVTIQDSVGSVTFLCSPFVGPHDTVGIDEVTFTADHSGYITLCRFTHTISYTLPDSLKSLVKKQLPGDYE